jgi:hypothetical protein
LNDPRRNLSPTSAGNLWGAARAMASATLDGIIRMSATRTNYWLEFLFTGSLATTLLATGVGRHNGSWLAAFLTVLAGCSSSASSNTCSIAGSSRTGSCVGALRRSSSNPRGYDALPFFLPSAILLGLTLLFALVMPGSHACLLGGAIAFGYVGYGSALRDPRDALPPAVAATLGSAPPHPSSPSR